MRRTGLNLPVITIDPTLLKSIAENNKDEKSPVGEMFYIRTPVNRVVIPIENLPKFTKIHEPECVKDGEHVPFWDVIDTITPIEQLIQPKEDLLRTSEQIKGWILKNYFKFDRPMHYAGHEANSDNPDLWDEADLRVLIVRLSSYDAVNGSITHGALAQLARKAGKDGGFKVYTDFAYMPGLSKDAAMMQEGKCPWLFGRTSKRSPRDFDVIFVSLALTMEVWNSVISMVNSGIAPFKTMRQLDHPLKDRDTEPLIIYGGVVIDFVESIYGEVAGQACVPDACVLGDGEYTVPAVLNLLYKCKNEGKTKREFLKLGHTLSRPEHFERDSKEKLFSWWYEPDAYEHVYKKSETETVWTEWDTDKTEGKLTYKNPIERRCYYNELVEIKRKSGYEFAAPIGSLKRAIVRDLDDVPVFTEPPLQYDGSLGPAVDLQISSGCTCVAGMTVIETDVGFERIDQALERVHSDEIGAVMVQTRKALQPADAIVCTGEKVVRAYTFEAEDGFQLNIHCTGEHKFDVSNNGSPQWKEAKDLVLGEEVWAVDPKLYQEARGSGGRNIKAQNYYAQLATMKLVSLGTPYETVCYDVRNSFVHEYIAEGLITHNSGGTCSFCLAEGTKVSVQGEQLLIEDLEDGIWEEGKDRELDTPFGLQTPKGVVFTGIKPCVTLKTCGGYEITLTEDHKLLTFRKGEIQEIRVAELEIGKDVAILIQGITGELIAKKDGRRDFLYPPALRPKAKENRVRISFGGEHVLKKDEITAEQKEWFRVLRRANAYSDVIISKIDVGEKRCFDVWNINKGHIFYANAFCVGNCHESHIQGRLRERGIEYLKKETEKAIRKQGAQEVSFYALSWSLHSQVYKLLLWYYERFGTTNLISQRVDQASADPDFFKFQSANGERSATLGVEGISQRMRNFFNKSLSEEQIIQACENAAISGYQALKWFMIFTGLETKADCDEFCNLLRDLNQRFKKIAKDLSRKEGRERSPLRLTPSIMLLINLPHTPLQWGPCAAAFDLESDALRPLVDCCKECGFGFRTSMTRRRIRFNQSISLMGREGTRILTETSLRANFPYFGPVPEKITYLLERKIEEAGYDWMYYLREKNWDTVFPWDNILMPQRRDYIWNQWIKVRDSQGISYCLKTSVNPNPRCSDCGGCGTILDRRYMLSRDLETSEILNGKEATRRDMTSRKKVRLDVEIKDELLRTVPKHVLARVVVRAFMLAASEKQFDHQIVLSYLKVDGHSLKHAEGMNNLPWVGGHVLIDVSFNKNWSDILMRELLPRINEILAENYEKGQIGIYVNDFIASDKLVVFDEKAYGLYTINLPISFHDLEVNMELFNEQESLTFKEKKSVGRDIFRMEEVTKIRSTTVPLAYTETHKDGIRLTFLCNLTANPVQMLTLLTGKRGPVIKENHLYSLGYFRYDREKADDILGVQEDDLFAALEGRAVYCENCEQPIPTDLFTCETYRSQSAENYCLVCDLKGLVQKKFYGVEVGGAAVTPDGVK